MGLIIFEDGIEECCRSYLNVNLFNAFSLLAPVIPLLFVD
jgi:hypothetical protein